jgi:acyl dehydratase
VKVFQTWQDVQALGAQDVISSDWIQVTPERVQQFAVATGDWQWIHVDVERACQGPFGGPIAHGFLTLSLLPAFQQTAMHMAWVQMGLNYGLNKVRFTSPVPVDSRLRAHFGLLKYEPLTPRGVQLTWSVQVEREGLDKPVCVAESLMRFYD